MRNLMGKGTVYLCCFLLYLTMEHNFYTVVPSLAVLCYLCIMTLTANPKVRFSCLLCFTAGCLLYPDLLYFLPVALHELFLEKNAYAGVVLVLPVIFRFDALSMDTLVLLLGLCLVAFVMKFYLLSLKTTGRDFTLLRNRSEDYGNAMKQKNQLLMEKQDYEINLATLNERNRIAREIHDSVGHVMTRAILQTGALLALTEQEPQKESLMELKETLTEGMNSIRSSVHHLHEDSVNLETRLYALAKGFTFCPLEFKYSVCSSPDSTTTYSVIAIAKEGLSNIARHSDAQKAHLSFNEMPGFYQLIISDNGTSREKKEQGGIGLLGIAERVDALGGLLNILTDHGFKLFISIPKEGNHEYPHH